MSACINGDITIPLLAIHKDTSQALQHYISLTSAFTTQTLATAGLPSEEDF